MKNIFWLLIIGVAGFKLAASFMNPEDEVTFLSSEINIWMYRAIWLFAGCISIYSLYREKLKLK